MSLGLLALKRQSEFSRNKTNICLMVHKTRVSSQRSLECLQHKCLDCRNLLC